LLKWGKMDRYRIVGGNSLKGKVSISGSKNASLPLMAASLLTKEDIILHNVPRLNDIFTMKKLLEELGKKIIFEKNTLIIKQSDKVGFIASYDTVKTMRASITILGPLLAHYKEAYVSFPGGCSIGNRPVDLHIKAMEALGAKVELENGYINAKAPKLVGAKIHLMSASGVTVLGTGNALMAATLAQGRSVIDPAAREPEIEDLANLLVKMGAKIEGIGSPMLTVDGVNELHGAEHTVIADRIEAGTFIAMVGAVGGEVILENLNKNHLKVPIEIAREIGLKIEELSEDKLKVSSQSKLKSADIVTMPYPDFPTDMQPQFMILLSQTHGKSSVQEMIFEDRLHHVAELARMGAKMQEKKGNIVLIEGPMKLKGAPVMASDLRAGAGLVIAALVASGESIIERIYHIDRGYENFEEKIRHIGGNIIREKS
jgi:UDP-N-acetylglucosamine 1-carboxyvinyltransferase